MTKMHFIGIGGIGMSGLASILVKRGIEVSGSDVTPSAITDELQKKGVKLFFSQEENNITPDMCVAVSSAIKEDNLELQQAKKLQLAILHRSELLASLMQGKKGLLVAGTHGKTTTTSLLAHVLKSAKLHPSYAIGGMAASLPVNAEENKGEYFVAEADESDGSFLRLPSFGAIVTNIEEDHLDYWKNLSALKQGFVDFSKKVESLNHFFWCQEDSNLRSLQLPGMSYGFSETAAIRAKNIRKEQSGMVFDITDQIKTYRNIHLPLMGEHNVLNATAVFGMAIALGIKENKIRKALASFMGVQRRQEKIGEYRDVLFYDDYAHHPSEIAATLKAFREKFEERRLVVLFQPHRYTRCQDLFTQFGGCFDEADTLILTDIYAAGEKPIGDVTSETFFAEVKKNTKADAKFIAKEDLLRQIPKSLKPHDVFIALGAGDVTKKAKEIVAAFPNEFQKWKVGLLFGGKSSEHEVSIVSAKYIHSCLDPSIYDVEVFGVTKEGQWQKGKECFDGLVTKVEQPMISAEIFSEVEKCDLLFPVFHGTCGEDGMMAAFFQLMNIPFTGCDYASAAVSMNKAYSREITEAQGIKGAGFVEVARFAWQQDRKGVMDRIEKKLGHSLFVKPVHLGSSIGISPSENRQELETAIDKALSFDNSIMVEQRIRGREIEVSIIGNDYIKLATPGEILTHGEFYDYDQKYHKNNKGMNAEIPAKLSKKECEKVQLLAKKIYEVLGCKGLARIDFFLEENGKFLFNEINPMPGCTPNSVFPKAWLNDGWKEKDMVDKIIIAALQHHRKDKIWAKN